MKVLLRHSLVLLAVLVSSCADEAPVAPTHHAPQFAATDARLQQLAQYQGGPLSITVAFAAKTIGPEGGTIRILGFEAVVPPGAVDKATRFTIRVPVDPHNSEYVRAEFGPHGQQFAAPVTLRLPLKGTTAEGATSVRVLWWDGAQWIPYESRITEDGRLETRTNHFSEYGTEGEQSKGIILGGGS